MTDDLGMVLIVFALCLGVGVPGQRPGGLVGYSSSLMFALNIVLTLLPEFFFLQIFVAYTFYIIWEGAGPYMGVEEKIRLKFVAITTVVTLLAPAAIQFALSLLMPGMSF